MTRNRTLLIALVAAAGALFGYWHFLLAPKRAQAAQLSTEIATHQAAVAQGEATVAQYARLRDTYPANYQSLVRLGKAVPSDDDVRSLLVQLASSARRSGVSFRKIAVGGGSSSPQPTVSGSTSSTSSTGTAPPPGTTPLAGGVSEMPFNFTFTGRFTRLGGFLSRIERYVRLQRQSVAVTGRLLRVSSITLAPGGTGYPTLEAQVDASTYLAAPPKPVAAPSIAPAAGAAGAPASSSPATPTTTTTATVTGAIR